MQITFKIGGDAPKKDSGRESTREYTFFVRGMHCASCELLIEKKLLSLDGVESVDASTAQGQVTIECRGDKPSPQELNEFFKGSGYVFSDQPRVRQEERVKRGGNFKAWAAAAAIIIGFLILSKSGLASLVNVEANSSLPFFFFFGVLAGLSSCAALVGGLVLSMSKQWAELYPSDSGTLRRLQPHFLFNAGRLVAYGLLGAVLGGLGNKLQLSFGFSSFLVMGVSVLMIILALQMLGVRSLTRFQITMPKFITRRVADESKFKGRFMPLIFGALTFFLPCGFTITAQGLALLSGSMWQGALIMFFFALGTLPTLLAIGVGSAKLTAKPHLANQFLKAAGVVIIFFALFNVNAQLNLMGWPSLNDFFSRSGQVLATKTGQAEDKDLPPIVDGRQVIKMTASSYGYNPSFFKIRAGVPVRWEITDAGTSGCTNAVLSRGLFDGQIDLNPGAVSVKEFTPSRAGKYKFSCWMGMVSGTIEVVDVGKTAKSSYVLGKTAQAADAVSAGDEEIIPSGASGCGCAGNTQGVCPTPLN